MKKSILTVLLIVILGLMFIACGEDGVVDGDSSTKSYLTIVNNSMVDLYFVKWMDGNGNFQYFGYENVQAANGSWYRGIAKTHRSQIEVIPSTSKLYFWYSLYGKDYNRRTVELITVKRGENKIFYFNNSTVYETY